MDPQSNGPGMKQLHEIPCNQAGQTFAREGKWLVTSRWLGTTFRFVGSQLSFRILPKLTEGVTNNMHQQTQIKPEAF